MKINTLITFLFVLSNLFAFGNPRIWSQDQDTIRYNHKRYIDKLETSEDNIYQNTLKAYDAYLSKNPNDISVHIQKCKFVENAQYDEYEEYNPNQEYLDSISTLLLNKYPNNPEVLIYYSSIVWGDDLNDIFDKGKESIKNNFELWTSNNLGDFYYKIANQYYLDDDYEEAKVYMNKSRSYNDKYKSTLTHVNILIELDDKEEALQELSTDRDTIKDKWYLYQKSGLFLRLGDYSKAIEGYNLINNLDSTYIDKSKLAEALEGIEKYSIAREYLVRDTVDAWNQESTRLKLFIHDVKYQNTRKSLESYNAYRNLGYTTDPMSLYRLKIFFQNPFLPWKAHDFLGIITLLLLLVLIFFLPSIWILPVYFIGHKWQLIKSNITENVFWGLKSFWWISMGFLIASVAALLVSIEYLNSFLNDSIYLSDLTQGELGRSTLIFIIVFGFFGLSTLNRSNITRLGPKYWTIYDSIFKVMGYIFVFKIISVIYIKIGMLVFNLSIDDIAIIPKLVFSSREEILALLSLYGDGMGLFIVGIFVPIYEEVIFRGVILNATKRYLHFFWANIFQSVLFATIHGDLFLFPVFLGFGIITGYLAKKSGSLLPGIIFHIINNIIAILYIIITTG